MIKKSLFMISKTILNLIRQIFKKKYNRLIIISILIYSLFLVGCGNTTASNSDLEYFKSENEELKLKVEELNEIIKSYKDNENMQNDITEKSKVLDILHVNEINGTYYIVLMVKGNETSGSQLWKYSGIPFAELLAEGIDINIETRDQYLYCTVLKGVGNDEYAEEVIKFDSENNESLIYKGRNVEISVSPNGEYFIIIENAEEHIESKDTNLKNIRNLKILDRQDKIIYDGNIKSSESDTELIPIGWNGSKFWAAFHLLAGRPEFLIFDTETLKYEVIENKADRFESELNIRTGWICYSDFPQFFDIDTYNEFKQSTKEVNLFLYNIFTDEKIEIATSVAKGFAPKWIDDYTFEYNDLSNNQRILYKLNSNN